MIKYIESFYIVNNKKSCRVQIDDINTISKKIFIKLGYIVESNLLDINGNTQVNLSKWL